ncbi:fatty acyl-AMP ligase [Mycobacterium sp. 1274761.0]|uniref:fatty acyl-AMP ligase n=1 Tax=Mycobacterium sp. 1274761.0 TaxID=1834077 RepID=UPI0007FBD47F|nr:fatty acyl-AMP ligase [Mycobacterium sp. 1274761.0]OBK76146.1 AMP-binding protein [Mycobacterium sp. 1274761.0]
MSAEASAQTPGSTSRVDDLVGRLRSIFEAYGDRRRFVFLQEAGRKLTEEVTTLRELDGAARAVAAWLSGQPHAARPVLLLFEPGLEFWQAFLGCLYAGVIAVPTPLPIDERSMQRVARILIDAEASLALTSSNLCDLLTAGIDGVGTKESISVVATDEAMLADADAWTRPALITDTVAFLQYTSGSTGDPKGVAVTHGNVVSNVTSISTALGLTNQGTLVGWIPHFHDMGLISVLTTLLVGGNIIGMSPLAFLKQPIRLLKAITDYRGTICAAPNFTYDVIARRVTPEHLAELDLTSWQIALNGAEPVRRRTIERIIETLAPAGFAPAAMRPTYGMAEVTLMATVSSGTQRYLDADADALEQNHYIPSNARAVTLVSSGRPAPGIEVRIVDRETRNVLPEDHVGEIWLRSSSVASGYYNRPESTLETFQAQTADGDGPFLRTGDLGLLYEGELYITGRCKDVLIINGRNIYPQDIEEFVQTLHPAVAGSRGVAVSFDAGDTERVVLIQAVKPEQLGDASFEQLAATAKSAIARAFEMPAPHVVFVSRPGIHLTTSGKVQRASMRFAFLAGELTDVLYESADPTLRAKEPTP